VCQENLPDKPALYLLHPESHLTSYLSKNRTWQNRALPGTIAHTINKNKSNSETRYFLQVQVEDPEMFSGEIKALGGDVRRYVAQLLPQINEEIVKKSRLWMETN
jgi:hypothetical protein